jgi:hypothetical protein
MFIRYIVHCSKTLYSVYPQFSQTITRKIQGLGYRQIRGLVTRELQTAENQENIFCGSLTRELSEEHPIPSETLLSRLSFTHFVELLRKDNPLERLFYEVEAIKNNWSVRELEQAILNHLQQFLIELGTGFCFEARQKRITFDNTHYHIDLVFYHRILKSHVLIDLKIGKFDHADAGQMNVYLNYYKDNEMAEGDNPPIGLILCGDKSKTLAKYATSGMDNQLFVSKFLVKLPEKEVLEEFIKRELE